MNVILAALLSPRRPAVTMEAAIRTIQVQDETIRHLREHIRDLNVRIDILERDRVGLETLL
jgi:hypothetical protein